MNILANKTNYGELVKAIRDDIGLSFSEYCKLTRFDMGNESRRESGEYQLTHDHVEKVIDFFSRYGYHVPELRVIATAQMNKIDVSHVKSETQRLIISKIYHSELTEEDLDMLDIVITEFLKYRLYTREMTRRRKEKSRSNKNKNKNKEG